MLVPPKASNASFLVLYLPGRNDTDAQTDQRRIGNGATVSPSSASMTAPTEITPMAAERLDRWITRVLPRPGRFHCRLPPTTTAERPIDCWRLFISSSAFEQANEGFERLRGRCFWCVPFFHQPLAIAREIEAERRRDHVCTARKRPLEPLQQ
nr:hypothetical protein [Rhizobium bangladeshense]